MLEQSKPLHPASLIMKQQVFVAPCHVLVITEDRYTFLMMTSKWGRICTELRSLAVLQQHALSFNALIKPSPSREIPLTQHLFFTEILLTNICVAKDKAVSEKKQLVHS